MKPLSTSFCPACDRQGRLVRLVRAGYAKRPQGGWTTLLVCPETYTYTAEELRQHNPPPIVDQHAFEFIELPAAPAAVPERLL